MWCPACRADVAAELSADNRRMLCTRCHSDLGMAVGAVQPTAARSPESERNARELLARWSTQHLLETPAPTAGSSAIPAERPARPEPIPLPATVPLTTAIPARELNTAPRRDPPEDPTEPQRKKRRKSRPPLSVRSEAPADGPDPETLIRKAVRQPPDSGNWATTVGQLCAYGGVGVLTLGTVMVLSGYFGGPTHYAPTGWLVAAVGQMLLFLGVVTLVSGGMEQTVDAVAWRIDQLSDQVERLERELSARRRRQDQRPPRRSRSDAA